MRPKEKETAGQLYKASANFECPAYEINNVEILLKSD